MTKEETSLEDSTRVVDPPAGWEIEDKVSSGVLNVDTPVTNVRVEAVID